MKTTRILLAATALSLIAATCTQTSSETTVGQRELPRIEPVVSEFSLQRFNACDDFLTYVKSHAKDIVGPYGFGYGWGFPAILEDAFLAAELDFSAPRRTTTAAASIAYESGAKSTPAFSTTNVQEKGVDEPDIVKTDGRRLLVLTNGELRYVDVTGASPQLRGTLRLGDLYIQDMLLSGDTVLLIAQGYGDVYTSNFASRSGQGYGGGFSSTLSIVEVDISDGDNMRVTRQLEMDGRYVSARMIGDTVRLVVNSSPVGLQFVQPEGSGLRAERQATEANKQIIEDSTIENWVPYYVLETVSDNGRVTVKKQGALLSCNEANAPADFAGLDMISIVTIDISKGLDVKAATGVLSSGETVYASTDALYIATNRWVDWQAIEDSNAIATVVNEATTDIHKFDISDPDSVTYRGSGSVKGYMLSQWSMSEYNGDLRVASTSQPDWRGDQESESFITVLTEKDGTLETIGQVGGIGKSERIFAVRFIGDVGYVVTFRQTDPLYTLDLSDPTDPKVVGELKIPGYSAYLHPISDDLLIGVGQAATDNGRVLGTQVSLFDVSDPANPKRIDKYTIENGNSEAEWDHRAFLYWEPTGLVVLPITTYSWNDETGTEQGFVGAIGLEITKDGIREVKRISNTNDHHNPWDWESQVRRSVVIGEVVYTISEGGLLQSSLDTLERKSFVRWYQ